MDSIEIIRARIKARLLASFPDYHSGNPCAAKQQDYICSKQTLHGGDHLDHIKKHSWHQCESDV